MTKDEIKGLLPGTIFALGEYSDYHKSPWHAIVRKGWDGEGIVIDEFYRDGKQVTPPGYCWIPNKDEGTYMVYEIPLLACVEEW